MSLSISRGIHTTSRSRSCNSEHAQFLTRNKVDPTYSGPVFSTETIYVPCGYCGTPVDPVSRVPVGRMFFHPHCLRCAICNKVQSRTLPFVARQGQPVCQNCDRNKSVTLPPLRAAAFAERAQASINGVGTLKSIMERCATRSPTRRGHAIEMKQLAVQQTDPNILLISSERQHELDTAMVTQKARQVMRDTAMMMSQNSNNNNNSVTPLHHLHGNTIIEKLPPQQISYADYRRNNNKTTVLPTSGRRAIAMKNDNNNTEEQKK